jgi:beta-glucosidase
VPQATYHFPTGFLWGTATSSHQVEGSNNNNNWAAWERDAGKIHGGERAGQAADWWGGRWKEDFDRAAETGQNAHRFSIEWSRIQPTPDHWDEAALDRYREMARGLERRGMLPLVTLHHFSDPLWITERGGWENDETPQLFNRYVAKVVEALKEYVTMWITINEPNVYTFSGYLAGDFPPGKKDLPSAFAVLRNMVRGHAAAYKTIHEIQPVARVGFSHNYRGFYPARSWLPLDRLVARIYFQNFNNSFVGALTSGRLNFLSKRDHIPAAVKTQDFFGLQYYTADRVAAALTRSQDFYSRRFFPKDAEVSETGFIANVPSGFYDAMDWAQRFKIPVIITENGIDDSTDSLRPRYLVEHLHQVWRGLNGNWPVKGYFHWTLVDNFEWERGWSQRFGLWGLDTSTQARIRRGSVDLYAAICKENAISYEMVEKYAPGSLENLFPG